MTAQDFAIWLEALLSGDDERRSKLARPDVTDVAVEMVNGELRPAVVAAFPSGTFVLAVGKAAA